MNQNSKGIYSIGCVILLIGISIGLSIGNLPYVTFDPKVSLGEITNLILVLFVAVYIPFFLNKQINNKRIEKDIHIESCNLIRDQLFNLKKLMEPAIVKQNGIKKEQADVIVLRTRNISNMLDQLIIEVTSCYKTNKQIKKITDRLISNNNTYRTDLTLNLRDKKPKISIDAFISTEKQINTYLVNLSKLKMNINGA